MKKFIYILIIAITITAVCVSCTEANDYHYYYAKWEIIYPDTTIQYEDTLRIIAIPGKHDSNLNLTIKSDRGSNFISDNFFSSSEPRYPVSSTCPMRLIEYELLENK